MAITGVLCGGETRRLRSIDPHGRQMDDPADAALFACVKQGARPSCMDALCVLAPTILQDTSAIDDRINAIQKSKPIFGLIGRCNI
jgi:hypothetical protein